MAQWVEIIVSVLLVIGALFGLVGSYGLIRLPDPMMRMHGPTKATTLGVGSVLIASMVYFFATDGRISAHELLITLFLFITAPVSTLFMAKVHMLLRPKDQNLPTPACGAWANSGAEGPARGVRPGHEGRPAAPGAGHSGT